MKKIEFETLWGGIFGVIAVIATIIEMALNGFSGADIAGAIKDISGTIIVIMLLFVAIRQLLPKKAKNFNEAFKFEMEKVENKYSPLIVKNENKENVWDVASKLSAIYDNDTGAYHTFFEFDGKSLLSVSVSKTVFMGRTKDSFENLQGKIVSDICRKIQEINKDIKCSDTKDGFQIVFDRNLETVEDAKTLAQIVDAIMLLFIVEYKKS
ncbi:MAG: hypothetical protein IKB36_03680 [Clostridia bacterium]|nr:hypothetical protein [Clostridia bacterium]